MPDPRRKLKWHRLLFHRWHKRKAKGSRPNDLRFLGFKRRLFALTGKRLIECLGFSAISVPGAALHERVALKHRDPNCPQGDCVNVSLSQPRPSMWTGYAAGAAWVIRFVKPLARAGLLDLPAVQAQIDLVVECVVAAREKDPRPVAHRPEVHLPRIRTRCRMTSWPRPSPL